MSFPLEPDQHQRDELSRAILSYLESWHRDAGEMPASGPPLTSEDYQRLMTPPDEAGRPIESLLGDVDLANTPGIYHPSGGHLSYIPNAGLYSGAMGELLGSGLNRYTGVASAAPGMAAIEHGVIAWMLSLFGYGDDSGGVLLSGGSTANFTAVVAARTAALGEDFAQGVIYVSPHTHHSLAKAARLAGISGSRIRVVEVDHDLRMEPTALASAIRADRGRGLTPFLVVASAGTTDTGTVDDLDAMADVAEAEECWLHVDGAYGAFFQLTERGRAALHGIGRADSITLDPHKGLSIPFGVGALLVREQSVLVDANQGRGAYLLEDDDYDGLRDMASLGPELTRPNRGLAVWLPLHLHGVAAFREALDQSLDLAGAAYDRLSTINGIEAPRHPDLSIVAFGFSDEDTGRRAMEAVNADGRAHISSTEVAGQFVLRLAILNRRTTADHVDHVIDIIEKTLAG
jgi:aromatic-L-amino-acid decarboxylase